VKNMSEDINYGKNEKRIIFTDTDHRHAQLVLKLKNDGLTQAKFFRSVISGYLSDDYRIKEFVVENGDLSIEKKKKNLNLFKKGKKITQELGLSEEQVGDIFDMIAGEFPKL